MDLSLTEEQEALRDSARALIDDHFPFAAVRSCENDPSVARDIYRRLAELGLGGILVSEAHGGLGLGLTDIAVAQGELGRGMVPLLFTESTVLAASVMDHCDYPDAGEDIAALLTGDMLIACAFEGDAGGDIPRFDMIDGENVLTGESCFVSELRFAHRLLVRARGGAGEAVLCLVDAQTPALHIADLPNLAEQSMQAVRFAATPVRAVVAQGKAADDTWSRAMARMRIAIAAQAVGGAQRLFDMTCDYARMRHQFGRPIGAFQAIAHMLADAAVNIEGARILLFRAAAAADEGADFVTWADMAKLKACQTYRDSSAMSIQVHGGIGFTLDADPQLFFRRAKHLQLMYGGSLDLRESAGAALLAGMHRVLAA